MPVIFGSPDKNLEEVAGQVESFANRRPHGEAVLAADPQIELDFGKREPVRAPPIRSAGSVNIS
jgi:hypothetical protein